MNEQAINAVSALLLPVLLLQGQWVRRRTPRLPGAADADTGVIEAAGAPLRLLVLGESTVAGVGADTHDEALTGQTARALSQRLNRTVIWRAAGRNGLTARGVRRELIPLLPQQSFDVVVIALGVNDTLAFHGAAKWRRDLTRLITALRERVGSAPVVLAAVPPMHRFPALPRPLRDVLGWRARMLDEESGRLAAQLDAVIHAKAQFDGGAEYFCADRFHPSVPGYKRWGEDLAERIVLSTEFQSVCSGAGD